MTPDQFIQGRKPHWNKLNALVERLARRGARRLAPAEVNELLYLYRETSADLARLRAIEADPEMIHVLNRIVTRAHGQVYGRRERARTSLINFFLRDYPCIFRKYWRYSATSLLITAAFTLMGYVSVQHNPSLVADILGGAETEFRGEKTGEQFQARFRSAESPVLSSMVTTNNIMVALTAFALGATFGLGTVYVLIVNGAMLGGFAGAYARSGAGRDFWTTVLVHGGVELSAIVVAGGAGLIMGHALWCPGTRTRLRALQEDARDAARIALGLIPAFIIAGILEGFVTPSATIPRGVKLALGMTAMGIFWLYLAGGGRRRGSSAEHATEMAPVLR